MLGSYRSFKSMTVVEHRRGVKHSNADALSRRPCLPAGCKYCDRLEDWRIRRSFGRVVNILNVLINVFLVNMLTRSKGLL